MNKPLLFALAVVSCPLAPALAQQSVAPGVYAIPGTAPGTAATSPALPPAPLQTDVTPAQPLPAPIHDDRSYSMTLFDLLEYRPKGADSSANWDIQSWHGGDYRRFVFKTKGEVGTRSGDTNSDFQLLSSQLKHPFLELQYGARLQTLKFRGANVARPQAVLGLEALVPYNYRVESALYLDPKGNLSAEFTGTKDVLFTQRLILQGRLEANAAVQGVDRFGLGSGLNNLELGFRLRYEIRREFAPYLGVSFGQSYGRTASFIRQEGGSPSQTRFVAGVRAWF